MAQCNLTVEELTYKICNSFLKDFHTRMPFFCFMLDLEGGGQAFSQLGVQESYGRPLFRENYCE